MALTNTNRWANLLEAENSVGNVLPFNHPFLQSGFMFVGEVLCLFAFFISVHFSVSSMMYILPIPVTYLGSVAKPWRTCPHGEKKCYIGNPFTIPINELTDGC